MLDKLIVHCPDKEDYIKLIDRIGWYNWRHHEYKWSVFKERFAVEINNGTIKDYFSIQYYQEHQEYLGYTFTTAKELLKTLFRKGDKILNKKTGEIAIVEKVPKETSRLAKGWIIIDKSPYAVQEDFWEVISDKVDSEEKKVELLELKSNLWPSGTLKYDIDMHNTLFNLAVDFATIKPNKTIMSTIKNAFKSQEDKAMEFFELGTSKDLNSQGRSEFMDFVFETGSVDKKEFLKKIVEAYKEAKK